MSANRRRTGVTCEELLGFVDDYLCGALPAARRRDFEAHLAECPSCVAYLATYRDAVRLAQATSAGVEEPAELPEELVAAILASR